MKTEDDKTETPTAVGSSALFGEHSPDCDVNDINPEGIRKPCNCGQTIRNFFAELAEVCARVTNASDAERQALHACASKSAEETLSPNH